MQWEKPGIIGPVVTPVGDDIHIYDGPTEKWLSMPISPEEAGIMRNLPRPARDEFKKNVREYIRQMGQERGNPPGQERA